MTTMIAFLGTGLLGSNFTRALLKKGEQVHVWNRTFEKAKDLEVYGAKAFDQVAEAVKNADRIHLTLSDDQAVDEVLENASAGFKPGVVIIDHTTTSASRRQTTQRGLEKKRIQLYSCSRFYGTPQCAGRNRCHAGFRRTTEWLVNWNPNCPK